MRKRLLLVTALVIGTVMGAFAQDLYQVGDIVEFNGTKGYVYKVESNGRHGYAVSINSVSFKKMCTDKELKKVLFTTTVDDGEENLKLIEKFVADNNKSVSVFPVFEWAKSLGEGWYIPSVDELKELFEALAIAPSGEEDDSEGDDEETAEQTTSEAVGVDAIDYNAYKFKLSKTSGKFANKTSDMFKAEGGDEYVKNETLVTLFSSTIVSALPAKYALKAESAYKKDPASIKQFDQYRIPAYTFYANMPTSFTIFSMFSYGGTMQLMQLLSTTNTMGLALYARAIYKF